MAQTEVSAAAEKLQQHDSGCPAQHCPTKQQGLTSTRPTQRLVGGRHHCMRVREGALNHLQQEAAGASDKHSKAMQLFQVQ